jgi:hypothetical protein
MNVRVILASLAGAVFSFLLGWLVYGILLAGFYESQTTHYDGFWSTTPNMVGIFLSGWAMSLLFAVVFSKWANISTFVPGLTAAAIITFLFGVSIDLYFWSTMNLFTPTLLAVDVFVGAAFNGLVGGVVALVLGLKKEE